MCSENRFEILELPAAGEAESDAARRLSASDTRRSGRRLACASHLAHSVTLTSLKCDNGKGNDAPSQDHNEFPFGA